MGKTLQDYHDTINQALNIVMAYKIEAEQRSLVQEAQRKVVRTFVFRLDSQMMRQIIYGRTPGTLAEAFAIAQTVYYDHQCTQSQGYTRSQQKQNSSKKIITN